MDQVRPRLAKCPPRWGQILPKSDKIGRESAQVGSCSTEIGPKLTATWTKFGRMSPGHSTRLGALGATLLPALPDTDASGKHMLPRANAQQPLPRGNPPSPRRQPVWLAASGAQTPPSRIPSPPQPPAMALCAAPYMPSARTHAPPLVPPLAPTELRTPAGDSRAGFDDCTTGSTDSRPHIDRGTASAPDAMPHMTASAPDTVRRPWLREGDLAPIGAHGRARAQRQPVGLPKAGLRPAPHTKSRGNGHARSSYMGPWGKRRAVDRMHKHYMSADTVPSSRPTILAWDHRRVSSCV